MRYLLGETQDRLQKGSFAKVNGTCPFAFNISRLFTEKIKG